MQVCALLPSCAPPPAAEARGLAAERRLPARDDRGQPQHAPDHRAGGHGGAGAAARRLGRRGAGAAGADDHLGGGHDRRRRRAGDDDARRPRRCARRPPRRAAPPDPRLPAEAARAVAKNELYSAETRDLAAATAGLLETRGKRPLPCTLRPAPSAAPAPALRSARWCQTAVAPAAWCEQRLIKTSYSNTISCPNAQSGPSTRSSRSSSSSTGTSPGGSIWQLSPSPTVRTRTSPPACAARSRCRKLS